jgi:hypothetical protein
MNNESVMGDYEDGSKGWWNKEGQLHRTDGPAIEEADGSRWWYQNDQLHRTDGPAAELANGTKQWWVNGQQMTGAGFARWVAEEEEERKRLALLGEQERKELEKQRRDEEIAKEFQAGLKEPIVVRGPVKIVPKSPSVPAEGGKKPGTEPES